MDFALTKKQTMLIDGLKDLAKREKFKEQAQHIEDTVEFPDHLNPIYSEMGLLGMCLSPEYGGQGESALTAVLAIEELAKFSSVIAGPVFESNVGPVRVIDMFGTEEQKKRIIPGVCAGEYSVSVSMTEPEAGSDLTSLVTNVEDRGSHLVLNGQKIFTTGGGHASHYMVYTRFDNTPGYKGIGGVLVEKGMEGFTFGKQEHFMGLTGLPSSDLYFDNVKIPKENVVVQKGDFAKLMLAFDIERCGNSAMCLGIAGRAYEEARKYALKRKAFGRTICEFQAIQIVIAEMATQLDAARLLVYRAAQGASQGHPSIYESSMGKSFANQMVREVTDKAMQVFGGYGYSKEFPMERMVRDARGWGLAGGTQQMLNITLASAVFGKRFNQRPETE
ncbi:acyl-CoA dehydrogenase family protein [bacterium]|nr:acyl-CoA dehydrogenase family protein [bacterium]